MGLSLAFFKPSANFLAGTSSFVFSASTEARNFASTASTCSRNSFPVSSRSTGSRGQLSALACSTVRHQRQNPRRSFPGNTRAIATNLASVPPFPVLAQCGGQNARRRVLGKVGRYYLFFIFRLNTESISSTHKSRKVLRLFRRGSFVFIICNVDEFFDGT
jgi:hypothetical protein